MRFPSQFFNWSLPVQKSKREERNMPKSMKNLKSLLKCKFCRRSYNDDDELNRHVVRFQTFPKLFKNCNLSRLFLAKKASKRFAISLWRLQAHSDQAQHSHTGSLQSSTWTSTTRFSPVLRLLCQIEYFDGVQAPFWWPPPYQCHESESKVHLRFLSISMSEAESVHSSRDLYAFGGSVRLSQGPETTGGTRRTSLEQNSI